MFLYVLTFLKKIEMLHCTVGLTIIMTNIQSTVPWPLTDWVRQNWIELGSVELYSVGQSWTN